MANRVPITVRVDRFEGPLDLLLYLIQSHELDVSKISIAKITEQYVAYVRLMQELNFDIASDFLLMAATLIQWKSKSLLPTDVDPNALLGAGANDELTPEQLLRQLMEHQRFLDAGRELGTLPLLGDDNYTRPNTRKPTEKVWKLMDVTALALTYQDLLVKERKRTTILKKETVSLAEKISDFADRMEVGKLTGLRALLRDLNSRPETVVSFLATLELGRLKKMKLHQEQVYEEIYVELLESIKGFDTSLASGFDSIEGAVDKSIKARDEAREHDRVQAAASGTSSNDATGADTGTNSGSSEPLSAVGNSDSFLPGNAPTSDLTAGAAGDSSPSSDADQPGTLSSHSGLSGIETSMAGHSGTPSSDAGFDRTSASNADLCRTEASDASFSRTETGSRSDHSAGAGINLYSFDGSLADERDPDLRAVLSGTHHRSNEDHGSSGNLADGGGKLPGNEERDHHHHERTDS